jgi:cyclohexanecarboxyl-CoA dehydrogenase
MNFGTSPEQDALVDIARRFGQQHLAPFYQQREREGAFDRPTLREMGRLGFFGVELPATCGGLGLDCVAAGLVLEALSAADYNIGQLMVTVSLGDQFSGTSIEVRSSTSMTASAYE